MLIKNKFHYLFCFIATTTFIFPNIKDLTYPGYNRLYYYTNYESHNISSLDRVITNLPKERQISIKTDYGNKYIVELQLKNTVIMYKNGSRVYSTNKWIMVPIILDPQLIF